MTGLPPAGLAHCPHPQAGYVQRRNGTVYCGECGTDLEVVTLPPSRRSASTLTATELLDALAEIRQRSADVMARHQPGRHGWPRRSRYCTECGNPWPCWTHQRLAGKT